jgi:hypothetical protein
MQRAYVREELDASIEAAWDCLRDFADISAWAQGRVVTTEGTGVGMIRHVDTANGRAVERCEAHDDQAYTFSYRLLESPWPFRNYVATVRLTSAGPHRCVIEWSSTFDTDVPEGSMRTQVEQAYRDRFIAKLRDTLRQRQAGI